MKALKKYLAVLLLGLLVIAAAACNKGKGPEHTAPELTVSETSISGRVRDKIALPTATAKDYLENDISEDIRIKIYFREDEEYVLPKKNASLGVLLSQNQTFKPTKCGEYVVTYFVADEKDVSSESEVVLNVTSNPDTVFEQNLASVDNTGNWLYGEAGQNSALNEFGEITIAGKDESLAYGGASYKGEKIKNGDAVTVDFVAQAPNNVWFYDFAYLLTRSAKEDAPVADEATWPSYFHIRVQSDRIQAYLFTLSGNKNYALMDAVQVNLLDGNQHSLSLKIEASEDQLVASIWVDKDISATPTAMNTIYKDDINAMFPDVADALAPFSSEIEGWLSFGANITSKNISNDSLVIKGVTINGATELKAPSIKVAEMSRMRIDTEITLPKFSARDENDYSDLTSSVKLFVKSPNSEFEEVTETNFMPTEAGEYIFRYTVTDARGNLGYQDVSVLCSRGESTAKPVIDFGGEIEDSITIKINETANIPVPVSVTDSFGDDISARLKVELIGREKADLRGVEEFTFRAAGTNILRYSVKDYNDEETVFDVTVNVTDGATGNLLEKGDDWYFNLATYNAETDTVQINKEGASIAYGGQKIYDEKVSILWNYDIASTVGGYDGTSILMINLRGGKTTDTVRTPNNPNGSTNWGWPDGFTVVISRHYGILVKLGGWNSTSIATSAMEPGDLYELFYGKDTVFSFQATDVIGENGEIEGVRLEVWVDDVRIAFTGSFIDRATGDVLLNKRYLRANPSVLEAGWLDFYFNEVDTVSDPVEKTIIKSITIDGTKPVQKIVTIDKETDQEFVMSEPYTLPVLTYTIGEEDKSSEVKTYIAVIGEEPDFDEDEPYTDTTFTADDIQYMKGFVIYYVYEGEILKTVTVTNSSEIELTLNTDEVTGAKVYTEFTLPTVTSAKLGEIDVSGDITVKIKVGVFEYEADATYKPTSDEPVKISYYFYGKAVKTVTVIVAPAAPRTTDFAKSVKVTGHQASTWQSQRIYNNKIYLRFSLQKEFESGDLYEFTLRGSDTASGAWMGYPTGLNLSLYKNDNSVKFRVHANPTGHYPQIIFGESASSYHALDWSERHSLVYSVYDKYDEEGNFLGVTVEVWLDGEKVEFVKGADGTVVDGNVLIPAEKVLENPDDHNGFKIFNDSFFTIFGMYNGATINKVMNVHHVYLMKPTDELPDMPEDPAVFTIDKEDDQTFVMGEAYTLPVLTAKVGKEDRSDRVKVFIVAAGGTLDTTADPYTELTYTPVAADYKGFTVYYVYENNLVKTVEVANSASVSLTLSTEEIASVEAGKSFDIPTVTAATISGVDVSEEIEVKIVVGETEMDAEETYKPLVAGTIKIVYYFNGKAIRTLEVEVTESEEKLEITLSTEEIKAKVGETFTVPTVVSAMLGEEDHKDEISVKLVVGTKEFPNATTYTPLHDETAYIVYSYGSMEVKTLEVPVTPADGEKTNIADQLQVTPHKALKYTKQYLYNNKVYLNFSFSEDNEFASGDTYDFGLRGGDQSSSGSWCSFMEGLRIRLIKNGFGVYFQIAWGSNGAVTLAESVNKYTDVDWTAAHTMVYGAYDVYDGEGNFRGILVELWFDGSLVTFGLSSGGTANGASIESGKVLISAEKVNEEPKDKNGVSVFEKSIFYIWHTNFNKTITVHKAMILKPTDDIPEEDENVEIPEEIAAIPAEDDKRYSVA